MRAVVQRVKWAKVEAGGETIAEMGSGFLVLVGVAEDDTETDADWLAEKVVNLRVFEDEEGKLNRSLLESGGALLAVSQFTLLGDCRKGRRPSFSHAASPDKAEALYLHFVARVKELGVAVQTGQFQAMMDVHLINHGPVTLLLDSRKNF